MASNSSREIIHLVASLLVLTIAFTYPDLSPERMAIVAFGVGTGFILHELAHKFTAQRYGYVADYEASPMGLFLAIGLKMFTGIVFAAPGAVMIRGKYAPYGYYDPIQTGKEFAYISISGAVVNLLLAIIFLTVSLFITDPLVLKVLSWSAFINVFLAGFNMIPFGPLDGAKVWRYNPVLWGLVSIPAIILFLFIRIP
ncbi:MAG: M50 family metallopeptidase [Euryarchaeota archaeon]|nr:M50 family metallopeptidase [Euryarchaeota archaeon]MCG2735310.1 M50 family metallopeptidase [Candidatus Methanoperedenaceae archaeon]